MKIFISGYLRGNLGDDLLIKAFCDQYPNIKMYSFRTKESSTLKSIPNLIFADDKMKFVNKISDRLSNTFNHAFPLSFANIKSSYIINEKFDAYCEIGGSIFILPKKGMGNKFHKREYLRKKLSNSKIPYFILGSNFGPFYTANQLEQYYTFFDSINGTIFRDKYSSNLFSNSNKVEYAPDLAFNLDVSKYEKKKQYILISIINPAIKLNNSSLDSIYFRWLLKLIKGFVKKGKKVVLMSFCEIEGDLIFAKKLKNKIDSNLVTIYSHKNIEESLDILARAECIVASRFHAMVLAWLLQKPSFIIPYSNKSLNVIKDINPSQSYICLKDLTFSNWNRVLFSNSPELDDVINSARRQFKFLNNYLSSEGLQ